MLAILVSHLLYQLQRSLLSDRRCLSHSMCRYQVMMTLHFLKDVTNDAEWTQKIDHYVIFASLKSVSTW